MSRAVLNDQHSKMPLVAACQAKLLQVFSQHPQSQAVIFCDLGRTSHSNLKWEDKWCKYRDYVYEHSKLAAVSKAEANNVDGNMT